ncbi:MAG: hypothetical protein IPK20_16990 [Betaproteobacteria bacterium]|nr:hypothetical protein [Betaproteobacteria bacterium]
MPDRLGPGAELPLSSGGRPSRPLRVLRLAEKDPVVVFDGSGGDASPPSPMACARGGPDQDRTIPR